MQYTYTINVHFSIWFFLNSKKISSTIALTAVEILMGGNNVNNILVVTCMQEEFFPVKFVCALKYY